MKRSLLSIMSRRAMRPRNDLVRADEKPNGRVVCIPRKGFKSVLAIARINKLDNSMSYQKHYSQADKVFGTGVSMIVTAIIPGRRRRIAKGSKAFQFGSVLIDDIWLMVGRLEDRTGANTFRKMS